MAVFLSELITIVFAHICNTLLQPLNLLICPYLCILVTSYSELITIITVYLCSILVKPLSLLKCHYSCVLDPWRIEQVVALSSGEYG